MARLARYFSSGEAPAGQVAHLALVLAHSGAVLSQTGPTLVDIASTGGPGSLTTLLAPLFARVLGATISKIGVPGRPAGGLDVLSHLPGYNSSPDERTARTILARCGYLHIGAGTEFCPLDAVLFTWRQEHGYQSVRDLAIASLLAKKIAAGVSRSVFDVRVGTHGNFGATWAEAAANSNRLEEVARELRLHATCVIGAPELPQPFIGRGEAANALDIVLRGNATGRLLEHSTECLRLAALATGIAGDSVPEIEAILDDAGAVHYSMLEAHGADPSDYDQWVSAIRGAKKFEMQAMSAGTFDIDLSVVRSAIVDRQTDFKAHLQCFADPCGVEVLARPGEWVKMRQPLLMVRDELESAEFRAELSRAISITGAVSAPHAIDVPNG